MDYDVVLPPDTQNEIDMFVETQYPEPETAAAVVDALLEETEKLAANPTLGAVPLGSPFETRRVHRFTIAVGSQPQTLEFLYRVFHERRRIVLTGFREVTANQ